MFQRRQTQSLIQKWGDYLAKKQGGWHCHYCEIPIARYTGTKREIAHIKRIGKKQASVDHRLAKSEGGSDEPENLVLCCHDCNQRKGSMNYRDFLKLIRSEKAND